jgi:hypothetical protein
VWCGCWEEGRRSQWSKGNKNEGMYIFSLFPNLLFEPGRGVQNHFFPSENNYTHNRVSMCVGLTRVGELYALFNV